MAVSALASVGLFAFFNLTEGGAPLKFSAQGLSNLGTTLAPLIAVAAFIERAVEVVISTWRDDGAAALQDGALDAFKRRTRSYAYGVSLGLSLCATMVGVRGVSALLDPAALGVIAQPQQHWFAVFDVVITALLLSGGSDGIHQIVTTVTTFLSTSKDKMHG
jgi:hypothetical protein